MQAALPVFDALHHVVPGAAVVSDRREEVVLARLLTHRCPRELLQRPAHRGDAALQVVEGSANAVKQDSVPERIGLHRRGLNGPQEDARLPFTEQFHAELQNSRRHPVRACSDVRAGRPGST